MRDRATGPVEQAVRAVAHWRSGDTWRPVPRVDERAAWDVVDDVTRTTFVDPADASLGEAWPALPAHLWRRFADDGDRLSYEQPYFARRQRLATGVAAAALTRRQDLLLDVADGLWAICEESAWHLPAHDAHRGEREALPTGPVVDLFAAETAANLAWAAHVLAPDLDAISPVLRRRVRAEVTARVLDPYRGTRDFAWFGRGSNNWNPWIHSNLIVAALFLGGDDEEQCALLAQAAEGLDHYLAGLPADGGCDEGVDYWWRAAASAFECLEWLWSASGGAVDLFGLDPLPAAARYPWTMHVADGWQVNFGDGAARWDRGASRNGASPWLLHRIGVRVEDPDVCAQAVARRRGGAVARPDYSLSRILPALVDREWATAELRPLPLAEHVWLPETQVLVARQDAASERGAFVAVKGGHNAESHNHNDVGSFVLAWDGEPVLVDAGVGTYAASTFDPDERYSLWTMRSGFHNLPVIDGYEQEPGRRHAARDVVATHAGGVSSFTADLAAAYSEVAGIERWQRTVALDREVPEVVIEDVWQAVRPIHVIWRLLVRGEVERVRDGFLVRNGESVVFVRLAEAAGEAEVDVDVVSTDGDSRLTPVWGPQLQVVSIRGAMPAAGRCRVVVCATAHDSDAASRSRSGAQGDPWPARG